MKKNGKMKKSGKITKKWNNCKQKMKKIQIEKKTEEKSHNTGSPPQTARYSIWKQFFLTIGYHDTNRRLTLSYIYICMM
jgi:hypothetical protein